MCADFVSWATYVPPPVRIGASLSNETLISIFIKVNTTRKLAQWIFQARISLQIELEDLVCAITSRVFSHLESKSKLIF